jgi:integrase
VRKEVARICDKVKVMKVCAHAMRGLHSTLAVRAGMTGHVVAQALGHESFATTLQSYAQPGALAAANQETVLKVLEGGRS